MKRTFFTVTIAAALIASLLVSMVGCAGTVQSPNLMDTVNANPVQGVTDLSGNSADVTDFALRLFKASKSTDKNTLLSPLSVLCALAMTVNGAKGQTKAEMEAVLGMDANTLNEYLYSYIQALPQGEDCKLNLANSIWLTDDEHFTPEPDFLQCNADYYGADLYQAPFDNSTLKDINNWVNQKTDGMIPEILQDIPDDAVMYLINALAFDADWTESYEAHRIMDRIFTLEDGTTRETELMYSSESRYLSDDNATGFIKYYKDRKYAFVALLPNEGMTVSEYVDTLDGAGLQGMLANAERVTVNAAIPKFETTYTRELSEVLKDMGMVSAFDGNTADFSGIGSSDNGNLFINRVLHKTFISVSETGTKAGAATVVEITNGSAGPNEEPKIVHLDRPFVYMLIDTQTNIPFFIGTMMDLEG